MNSPFYTFCYWFLIFITYSFLGWAYESTLCSITGGKPVNRGFLTGPLCPVYGFGVLFVLFTVGNVEQVVPLFLSSAVITCTVEYVTAWLLEKLFHAKWWDYSDRRFNLHGRVCLAGAVAFGAMSVLVVKLIHPRVVSMVQRISPNGVILIGAGVLILFCIDLLSTVRSLVNMTEKLAELQAALESYTAEIDWKTQRMKELMEESRAERKLKGEIFVSELQMALEEREIARQSKIEELKLLLSRRFEESEFNTLPIRSLKEKRSWQERRLLRAFPKMKSHRYGAAMEELRRWLEEKKKN